MFGVKRKVGNQYQTSKVCRSGDVKDVVRIGDAVAASNVAIGGCGWRHPPRNPPSAGWSEMPLVVLKAEIEKWPTETAPAR